MISTDPFKNRDANLLETIRTEIKSGVHTSIPGKVIGITEFKNFQMVDVQPLINDTEWDYVALEPPALIRCPVVFPSAGGGLLSFPIKIDDTVAIFFCERSISEWLFTKGTELTTPDVVAAFRYSDSFVVPGLYTSKNNLQPNTTDVEMKFNNLSFRLEESGDIVLENPTGTLTFQSDGTVLHYSGARITPEGDFITAAGISLDQHVHSQGNDSSNNSQVNTDPPQ